MEKESRIDRLRLQDCRKALLIGKYVYLHYNLTTRSASSYIHEKNVLCANVKKCITIVLMLLKKKC